MSKMLMNALIERSELRCLLDELYDDLEDDPLLAKWEIVYQRGDAPNERDRAKIDRTTLEPALV